MIFGEYIKNLRTQNNLSQRELAKLAGISSAEICRLETGERKKPSPAVLKAIYTYLGVPYEDLLEKAGYIEETVDHEGYTEKIYKDENGFLIDVVSRAKDMYDKDMKWANLAYRVSTADLSETELDIIKAQTESLLDQFLKNKKK